MAKRDSDRELTAGQGLLRELRTGHVADARGHLACGRHDEAAEVLEEVDRGLAHLEGRIQSFRRAPL